MTIDQSDILYRKGVTLFAYYAAVVLSFLVFLRSIQTSDSLPLWKCLVLGTIVTLALSFQGAFLTLWLWVDAWTADLSRYRMWIGVLRISVNVVLARSILSNILSYQPTASETLSANLTKEAWLQYWDSWSVSFGQYFGSNKSEISPKIHFLTRLLGASPLDCLDRRMWLTQDITQPL